MIYQYLSRHPYMRIGGGGVLMLWQWSLKSWALLGGDCRYGWASKTQKVMGSVLDKHGI
jgi:hypothetical protein